MFNSLKNIAAKVSDIDVNSVKGKITTTVSGAGNTISQTMTATAGRIREHMSAPADAYDQALEAFMDAALADPETTHHQYKYLKGVKERLIEGNPYRE